jgi:hypothetical protein
MRRQRNPSKLELFLGVLEQCGEIRKPELAQQFRDTLLRAGARRLLERFGLPLPNAARLFVLDETQARAQRFIDADAERSAACHAASEALLAMLEADDLPHALGALFEALASFEVSFAGERATLLLTRRRKKTGMFYTPSAVAREVAAKALAASSETPRSICDPACGSGAFLVEAARALSGSGADAATRRSAVERLIGVDLDRRALLVAELALWAFVGDPDWPALNPRLHEGDALFRGVNWRRIARDGFDLVIGNPPWVAFAGRAAQPLEAKVKAYYSQTFASFRGYPTLHALFVELALDLAPRGVVALLVPSPLADLDGYRALRRRLLATHEPCEPLLEFGQDAFQAVTQPCFALIAKARESTEAAPERRLRLAEREVFGKVAQLVQAPEVLLRMAEREAFPRELFGELGFQSNRAVSSQLFLRAEQARPPFTYPLLEGREVSEFRVGEARLFLHPDERVLTKTRCKLRLIEDYQRVEFVVRQTAKFPIAARHNGLPFRNTLLAGFRVDQLSPELVVGLLNSSLYRALHLARQRDARQKVFPQVKVAHLRALPRPPRGNEALCAEVHELARSLAAGSNRELRRALDDAVFRLFELSSAERDEVLGFVAERAPELSRKE